MGCISFVDLVLCVNTLGLVFVVLGWEFGHWYLSLTKSYVSSCVPCFG